MSGRSRELLQLVARVVSPLQNKLSISGHTDATPYQGRADYSNWELSTDRANAARRVLVGSGVNEERVENVTGRADTDPKVTGDPYSPENRRISILLLREQPQNAPAPAQGEAAPAPASTEPAPAQSVPAESAPAGSEPPAAPAEPSGPPPEIVPSGAEPAGSVPDLPTSIAEPAPAVEGPSTTQ